MKNIAERSISINRAHNQTYKVKGPEIKPEHSIEYFGCVNYSTNERVIHDICDHMEEYPEAQIYLTITSPGGPSGTAMSFFDHLRYILKPNLVTIASGDVDSSGIILFLTGSTRYITPHTTFLFHMGGRKVPCDTRFTVSELDTMVREDRIKDKQYASLIAKNSRNCLSMEDVLQMMEQNTICTPEEMVVYGLASAVLQ